MQSKRITPISVLRLTLGLTVAEFANLIGKSLVTVNSLETGRLKLSEETAHVIATETGVDMHWLMALNPKEKPYVVDMEEGKKPYTKEVFERVQARKQKPDPYPLDPALYFVVSTSVANDWHSVYAKAAKNGQGQLAIYRMRQFLEGLVELMGKDDEEFLRLNKDLRILPPNESEWELASAEALELKGIGGVLLHRIGGKIPARPVPRYKPAVTIPCKDVPHDSDGNTDWNAMADAAAAPEPVRKQASRKRKATVEVG